MERKLYALAGMVFCLAVTACQTSADESQSSPQAIEVKPFQSDVSDSCFDVQLEVWLNKFNQYQQQGTDMFDADTRAREDAHQAYLNCQSRTDVLANEAARK